MSLTNTALAQALQDATDEWQQYATDLRSWLASTADTVTFTNPATLEEVIVRSLFKIDADYAAATDPLTGAAAEAQQWASHPVDVLVPAGNEVDEYSAYHWAIKAGDAAGSAAAAVGYASAAEDARDLALSYRDTAQNHAVNAANSETAAETAKDDAETAAATATTAATTATTQAGLADDARVDAENAQVAAEAAQAAAEAASSTFDYWEVDGTDVIVGTGYTRILNQSAANQQLHLNEAGLAEFPNLYITSYGGSSGSQWQVITGAVRFKALAGLDLDLRTEGADDLLLTTNGTERVRVFSDGTVQVADLAGSGDELVGVDEDGVLTRVAVPSAPDLSPYPTKAGTETVTGGWTFSSPLALSGGLTGWPVFRAVIDAIDETSVTSVDAYATFPAPTVNLGGFTVAASTNASGEDIEIPQTGVYRVTVSASWNVSAAASAVIRLWVNGSPSSQANASINVAGGITFDDIFSFTSGDLLDFQLQITPDSVSSQDFFTLTDSTRVLIQRIA